MQLMPPNEFIDEHRQIGGQLIEALTFEAFVLHIQGHDGDLSDHFIHGGCSEAYANWLAANVKRSWAEIVESNPVIVRTNEELAARASLAFAVALLAGALLVWILVGSNTVAEWVVVGFVSVIALGSSVLAGINAVQLIRRWINRAMVRFSPAIED
ncbi:MAG: hypothetical protein KF784_04865 [Fimbriimonadaceae bacterium]|nr:hypothetical protein [Fimbriimonadaceae bacterium]